jgi:hypothetical protein
MNQLRAEGWEIVLLPHVETSDADLPAMKRGYQSGEMMAMKMEYEVRGAKVGSLPPDGTPVVVTMHDRNGAYYITDVKTTK